MKIFLHLITAVCIITESLSLSHAQSIVLDGSLGTAGALNGPDYQIKAEYGKQAGVNLFHSFQQFNLNTNESATFSGPDTVQNIISRVTGGTQSFIDGEIRTTIPNANLFLLNPAGVIFGANATLDLAGSFHVSTADYLRMEEESSSDLFYTKPMHGELLSSAAPSAFGFLDNDIAPISFQGKEVNKAEWDKNPTGLLKVSEGETISVIGGDIEINGIYYQKTLTQTEKEDTPLPRFEAPEGKINIVSVASKGEVNLNVGLRSANPTYMDVDSFENMGNISLDQTIISVSGEGSGDIFIRGGSFFALKSSLKADTEGNKDGGITDIQVETLSLSYSDIFSDTWGTGKGGDIQINAAEYVNISDFSKVYSDATSYDDDGGDAGFVLIETKNLTISNEGAISSDTYGGGHGGSVTLRAAESVKISGLESKVFAGASGEGAGAGDAGTVLIESSKISLSDKARISSDTYSGSGKGGNITITGIDGKSAESFEVSDSQILSGAIKGEEGIAGDGGSVEINAKNILFRDGGKIGGESKGAGKGGDIIISGESVQFSGVNNKGIESMAYTSALSKDAFAGDAGNIFIDADTVIFKDSGGITASTEGPGNAGIIEMNVKNLELYNDASISSASVSEGDGGDAGSIAIRADNKIILKNSSSITTSTSGQGKAGDIAVETGNIKLESGSSVASESLSENPNAGEAGMIMISTADSINLSGSSAVTTEARGAGGGKIFVSAGNEIYLLDSDITSSVKFGGGKGGDITTGSEFVIMNHSTVQANAEDGDGGAIFIYTDNYVKSYDSSVTATSKRGNDGTVKIEAPDIDISSSLTLLPDKYIDATRWMKVPCSARSGESVSRFVLSGRDAAPSPLSDWLPIHPLLQIEDESEDEETRTEN